MDPSLEQKRKERLAFEEKQEQRQREAKERKKSHKEKKAKKVERISNEILNHRKKSQKNRLLLLVLKVKMKPSKERGRKELKGKENVKHSKCN